MKPDYQISVIIVSYNTRELTTQCISSVEDDLVKSKLSNSAQIIIVDNNSTDDSVLAIKKQIKSLKTPSKLIENKKNLGFGAANNLAIEQSNSELLFFLNSDTLIKPGAIKKLIFNYKKYQKGYQKIGLLAAKLLNKDGSQQLQGGSLPTLFALFNQMLFLDDLPIIGHLLPSTQHTGLSAMNIGSENKPVIKGWVAATALLTSSDLIKQIGPFDQNIFMYAEDVELCMRAAAKGFKSAIDPNAEVVHLSSKSSNKEFAIIGEFKGWLYIWAKHKPHWQVTPAKIILQIGALLRVIVFGTIKRNQNTASIYLKVFRELIK